MVRALQKAADRLNFDVVWRDYYSPIPGPDVVTDEAFARRSSLTGVDWHPNAQLDYYERLLPFAAELGAKHPELLEPNESYDGLDAEVLYGMVRLLSPSRIVELGSGYSTLVSAAAVTDLRAAGSEVSFIAADPFPSSVVRPPPPGLDELRSVGAREFPIEELEALGDGDILFIDTTHVVKLGSEVNHLMLEVLPRLRAGVVVHIHDVFLPYEYPRRWLEERAYYWTEQYLVHAFLIGNAGFEVLLANHWLQREGAEQRPGIKVATAHPAGALWLRARGGAALHGSRG